MKMNYQELVDKGLLRKEKIGFDQIKKVLKRANQSFKSAKTLLRSNDEEGSFQFAYDAMLLAGRSLVFSYGFRPRTVGSHKIVVDFSQRILSKNLVAITQKFNKMRKKRNYLIYGIGLTISKTEAQNAIKTAEEFVDKVTDIIHAKNPQRKF